MQITDELVDDNTDQAVIDGLAAPSAGVGAIAAVAWRHRRHSQRRSDSEESAPELQQ